MAAGMLRSELFPLGNGISPSSTATGEPPGLGADGLFDIVDGLRGTGGGTEGGDDGFGGELVD